MTKIPRRTFLRGGAALGAAAAVLAVSGCDDIRRGSSPTRSSETPAATPSVPRRGGTLRAYTFDASLPDSFDPHLTQFGPIANLHSLIYSKLLQYDDELTGAIGPDLAESMPEQPDELTYIIKLRPEVRFHDSERIRRAFPATAGRTLQAADVVFSIERQLNRNSPQAGRFHRLAAWSAIDRMETPDASTVRITLKSPMAPFLAILAGRHSVVLPREAIDLSDEILTAEAMIGSGPFLLDSFELGVAARLRRNPDWFARNDGNPAVSRPYLDGYDSFFSPQEDSFQRAAFRRRAVDRTGFLEPAALQQELATNLADTALEETDAGGVLATRLLLDRPPFRDDRARRALHLAIDRQALADLLYPPMAGRPSAKLSGPIAPVMPWAIDQETLMSRPGYRAQRDDDLAEARALWAAALGEQSITEVRALFAGAPRVIGERALPAIQRQLNDALGLNLVAAVDPSGTRAVAEALRRNVVGAAEGIVTFTLGLEDGGVDLDDWLYPQYHSGLPSNSYRLQDPTLDAQLDRQRGEFDAEERRKIGLGIQEYLVAKVNARLDYLAPVERRISWGYVTGSRMPVWHGNDGYLADVWLDTTHSAWSGRGA